MAIHSLKAHPRNYREHPDDQIEHLMASLKRFGFYRNVVVSKDNVILAGHGMVKAARKAGVKRIPIIRMGFNANDRRAIKLMVGDNEIEQLAEQNDRLLADLLKDIRKTDKLIGTGFDDKMLANFIMVTRPASEIADFNEAAHWVGMPEYEAPGNGLKIVVNFENQKNREAFGKLLGIKLTAKTKAIWYPHRQNEDIKSLRFKAS